MQTRSPGTNFLSFTSTVSVVVVAGTDFEYILGAGINDFLARREPSCFLSSWKAIATNDIKTKALLLFL